MTKSVNRSTNKPVTAATARKFSATVLNWFELHGRKHLPWQKNPTPYRVWVSEIMLQQTQVATVIPYFKKFMQSFPDVAALAAASQDQVLQHWSGLGYYARGRNLHAAAQIVVEQHGAVFPLTVDGLVALPGIGRSTAGAILSLANNQHASILDGNVKRVLSRHYKVDGWYGQAAVEKSLWQLADALTPALRTGEYNQAMMDLGATVCTRSSPDCDGCPLVNTCGAAAIGDPTAWPHRKPVKDKPQRTTFMLILQDPTGAVLMERRPPSGIWGGLWGFPEFDSKTAAITYGRGFGAVSGAGTEWPVIQHTFSHFQLHITPVLATLKSLSNDQVLEKPQVWYEPGIELGGFAAPVSQLLKHLDQLSG